MEVAETQDSEITEEVETQDLGSGEEETVWCTSIPME
jgi:hypothetical protein